MKVLHISSSLFGENGNSSALAQHFLDSIKLAHPAADITVRDLAKQPVPHLDADTFKANITAAHERSEQQKQLAQLGDTLIEELLSTDVLVLSVPMYNFGIPSTLKAWIDQVARAGTTFKYTQNGPVGLVEGKKAYVLGARGGAYAGTPADTQTPFLKTFLGFIGITDVEFVFAEKLNMNADEAPNILAAAKHDIDQLLKA
ncbi:MAG: FMN-dependent NADH-azoreductase [Ketobacter sp.]|nr:FMN-dependent NADH-azoreductase [Ketobacter sp.]